MRRRDIALVVVHITATCFKSRAVGHLARACLTKGRRTQPCHNAQGKTFSLVDHESGKEDDDVLISNNIRTVGSRCRGIVLDVLVNGIPLKMEFDTGASVSIVSEEVWCEKLHSPALRRCKMELKAYSGHRLYIMGEADVNVQVNGQQKRLSFVVARDGGPPIFGRNWLMEITMAWKVLENNFTCRSQSRDNSIVALLASKNNGVGLDGLLRTYTDIFQEGLGKMSGIVAEIRVKPGTKPKFFKPRPVPYALKYRIEQDLDR